MLHRNAGAVVMMLAKGEGKSVQSVCFYTWQIGKKIVVEAPCRGARRAFLLTVIKRNQALRLRPTRHSFLNMTHALAGRIPFGRPLPVSSETASSVARMLMSPMSNPAGSECVRTSAGALVGRAGVAYADPPSSAPRRREVGVGEAGGGVANSSRVTVPLAGLICGRTHGCGRKDIGRAPKISEIRTDAQALR